MPQLGHTFAIGYYIRKVPLENVEEPIQLRHELADQRLVVVEMASETTGNTLVDDRDRIVRVQGF